MSPSTVIAILGAARSFNGLPLFGIIFLKQPMICEGEETRVQAIGDFDFWKELRADMSKYRKEKERLAGEVLQRLDEIFEGFASQVEMMDMATPCTTFRYAGNCKGAMMG